MRTILLAGLPALMLALPSAAQTQTAAREGSKLIAEFTATVKTKGRFQDGANALTTSAVHRVLKGRCQLQAGAVVPYGLDGPSKQQEKAMKKKDPGMASLEKEHAKCKGNQACLMALAQKMSEQDFQPKETEVEGAVQVWYPQSCSGAFTADDVYTEDIKDGGNLSYQARSTITGTATLPEGGLKGWLGLYVEHDLARNQTLYRFNEAEALPLDKKTVRTGYRAGTTQSKPRVGLTQRFEPTPWGPVKGGVQSGSLSKNIEGGTLVLDWRISR
ncbi:hypothetical protein MYXO_02794 [Myxococcaceae bacterium]|nr:hypothetical protein MYXO_02794 [Myxococcaceae bacterium]